MGRIRQPALWHRRECPNEQLTCCWPPEPPAPDSVRRKLDWSLAVGEGDTIGMLVTPSGDIVIIVNSERKFFVPEAGVPVDANLFPLVEVCNHIRSVRPVPLATPPK